MATGGITGAARVTSQGPKAGRPISVPLPHPNEAGVVCGRGQRPALYRRTRSSTYPKEVDWRQRWWCHGPVCVWAGRRNNAAAAGACECRPLRCAWRLARLALGGGRPSDSHALCPVGVGAPPLALHGHGRVSPSPPPPTPVAVWVAVKKRTFLPCPPPPPTPPSFSAFPSPPSTTHPS